MSFVPGTKQNTVRRTRQRDGSTTFVLSVNYERIQNAGVKVPVHRNYDCG